MIHIMETDNDYAHVPVDPLADVKAAWAAGKRVRLIGPLRGGLAPWLHRDSCQLGWGLSRECYEIEPDPIPVVMVTELKPCPFCGGKSVIVEKYPETYFVSCYSSCEARTSDYWTKQSAIDRWNTRATPSPVTVDEAMVERALRVFCGFPLHRRGEGMRAALLAALNQQQVIIAS